MKENEKQTKGITLIALVITIIVLLILAGVSIAMLTGQNGILTQAQNASKQTDIGKEKEQIALAYNGAVTKKQSTDITAADLNDQFKANGTDATASGENPITVTFGEPSNRVYTIDSNGNITEGGSSQTPGGGTTESTLGTVTGSEGTNTTVQDSLKNKVVIPAGFKVVNPTDNVEDGIIIEDVSHSATAGSQFVWIPVGENIKKKDGTTFNVKLSRYLFDENGIPTDKGSNPITSGYYEYLESNTGSGNTTAKENIESEKEGFRGSAIENGGYYIGRYEARTATERKAKTDPLTQITVKPGDNVYNYVTQSQAAERSQGMYSDSNFESDLMNSYAWDTAIVFIQECSENNKYSQQTSVNSTFAPQGTNNLDTTDVICNIYDMASNCVEWTTETSILANNSPCVVRGGYCYTSVHCTAYRYYSSTSYSRDHNAFRPILYL